VEALGSAPSSLERASESRTYCLSASPDRPEEAYRRISPTCASSLVGSSASAGLLASSTILANDVYAGFVVRGEHNKVLVRRVTTLLVVVVTLVISLIVSDVVGALTVAYDPLSGALFVPIVGALFWSHATAAGALVSMVVSSVVVVVFMAVDGLFANTPIIYGMVSLVVFVAVSLLTPRPSEERMRAWERRLTGSGAEGEI
jgi:solute:Na+ symporter, SSS family